MNGRVVWCSQAVEEKGTRFHILRCISESAQSMEWVRWSWINGNGVERPRPELGGGGGGGGAVKSSLMVSHTKLNYTTLHILDICHCWLNLSSLKCTIQTNVLDPDITLKTDKGSSASEVPEPLFGSHSDAPLALTLFWFPSL